LRQIDAAAADWAESYAAMESVVRSDFEPCFRCTRMSGPAPTISTYCLQTRFQLGPDFTPDTWRQPLIFDADEAGDIPGIPLRQLTKHPRERLHDHVVAIVHEPSAEIQSPGRVPRPSTSPRIERNRRHEGEAATPSIGRTRPSTNEAVGQSPLSPRHARDGDAKQVDRAPIR